VRVDPAGLPFIGGTAVLALLLGAVFGWAASIPFFILAVFFLYFFRDPNRQPSSTADNAVLAPADGRVLIAGEAIPAAAPSEPPGSWKQISIFLSPMDVHVNRVPLSGRVTRVSFTPGRFVPAYRHDAGSTNERSEIWIDHNGQTIVVRQIVGILARRVVCRAQNGATVHAGERYGIMKFGSRMDVFLPVTARMLVQVGAIVRGGETVIAVLE
jgi:phosphatidylserine decarboxylase